MEETYGGGAGALKSGDLQWPGASSSSGGWFGSAAGRGRALGRRPAINAVKVISAVSTSSALSSESPSRPRNGS